MKMTLATVLGMLLGVVIGAGGIHQWLTPQLLEVSKALTETQRELEALRNESSGALEKLARLEKEREDFSDRLAAAEARAESASKAAAVAPVIPEIAMDEPVADAAPVEEETESEEDNRDRRGDRGRDRGNPWGGTPEEREARRQEFVTRMQDNMTNFFTGELEKSSTPEMQDRLVALEEKAYEMFEIRSQMRQAETDEERQALGQAFGDAMAATRQLMVDQQEDMIGAIANQFGISRTSDQAAFEQAVRSAISSPFFSDNPGSLLWNAGRSDDGGPGGFGGGGFRRGGPEGGAPRGGGR